MGENVSMRMMTRFTGAFLFIALLAGCASLDRLKGPQLTDINITPRNLTLALGQEQSYLAEGITSDGVSQDISKKTIWVSSDTTVANFFKLDGKSTLLTVGPGTTTITGTLESLQGESLLIVTASPLKTIQISAAPPAIEVGKMLRFTVAGKISNDQTVDITNGVAWVSSEPAIATIDDAGLVTALAPGVVIITAAAGEMRSTAKLTVPTPRLTGLKITPPKYLAAAGGTLQFTAEGYFTNDTTQTVTSNVAWDSSDPSVVTIDANGLATVVAKGLKQARVIVVTAVSGNISKSAEWTVTPPDLVALEVTPKTATVAAGRTILFSAKGMLTDGTTVPLSSDVLWSSSVPSSVAISKEGLVSVGAAGEVVITATFKNKKGMANLTATPPEITAIRVSPAIPFVAAGRAQQFIAEGSFSDGSIKELKEGVQWSSENSAIAEITPDGIATAVARGVTNPVPVRLTVTSGKISATAKMTVTPPELKEIHVIPVIPFVVAGKNQQFSAQGTYTDGTDRPLTGVTWSALESESEPTAVTMNKETGLAITKMPKVVTITAVFEKLTGSAKLTITPPELISIRIAPDKDVAAGLTIPFTAEGIFTDGAILPLTSDVQWISSDPAILLFKQDAHTATALSQGKVTITASMDKIAGSAKLTVTPPALTAIRIAPVPPIIAGQTVSFFAEGTFTDSALLPLTSNLKWSSSDPAVLLLKKDSNAAVALSQGTVTLTAASGAVIATLPVTVLAPVLTAIRITPTEPILVAAGRTQMFTAEGDFSNGTTRPLTSDMTWMSSNISVVKIEKDSGLASALTVGEITITAIFGKINMMVKMIVTPPALDEIRVVPDKQVLTAGQTQQFSVEGIYTDKTKRSITSDIVWSASDTSVVTIHSAGLATTAKRGVEEPQTVTITASVGSIVGKTKLTVTPPQLTGISVTPISPVIVAGQSRAFIAIGTFNDGTTLPLAASVKWNSSEPSIVTVDNNGLAAAILKGMERSQAVTITAISGKIQGSTQLTVTPPNITEIQVRLSETSVAAGKTARFAVEGSFTDGTTRKLTAGVTGASSDTTIAIVDIGSGLIKTIRPGDVTLTFMSGKNIGATKLTVTPADLTSIRIRTLTPSIAAGRTASLTVEGVFTDGTTKPLRSGLILTSSHPSVLAVDPNGLATAIGTRGDNAQDVTVTATLGTISGTAKLTVTPPELSSLHISPDASSIVAGRAQQFSLEGLFSDSTTRPLTSSVTWLSSNPSVAKIDPTVGLANSLTPGITMVTASVGNIKAVAQLTVTPPELIGVRITPKDLSVLSGKTQQFVLMGSFTDKIDRPLTTEVTWHSSDSSVATMTDEGLVKTAERGVDSPLTVRISASYKKWIASTNLTVMPADNHQ